MANLLYLTALYLFAFTGINKKAAINRMGTKRTPMNVIKWTSANFS
jgi:hypothetical protein